MRGWRPTVKGELDACWATGRRYDTRAKYRLLPGTGAARDLQFSLPGFSAHVAQPLSEAAPTSTRTAPAVGRLLPGTCASWNGLVLHKLSVQMSGGDNLWAPVNLQIPYLCPCRCNRRQQREGRGRVRGKITLHASVFVEWPTHLWKMP